MPSKDKEQYVTLREFEAFKTELKELKAWSDRIHKKANEITAVQAKLELGLKEDISKLETQLILLIDIPKKLDKLIEMTNKDMIEHSKESARCANHTKEIEELKQDMLTKKDFESEKREGKYQRWFFFLLGGMITTIIYAILGTQLPQ